MISPSLPSSPALRLMAHQLQGVEIARQMPRFAFFWEPGAGKTILILAIVADAKQRGFSGRTLVLAPKSILHSAWLKDGAHFPGLGVEVVWHQNAARRRKMIEGTTADVLVTNYETFKAHAAQFLAAGVTRLIVDESSKIKSWTTQISKACATFAAQMQSVYILSGTPAPNNQTEYFGQMRCVDQSLFGQSFWRFAYTYFTPIKINIGGTDRITGWKPLTAAQPAFVEKLQSRSWSLKKSDCLDLPPQVDVVREIELGEAERRAYDSMLEELQVELSGGEVVEARVAARLMKLRQITGGILLDNGRAISVGHSKLNELADVMDELGDRKVIVWAQFTAEIDAIAQEIQKTRFGRPDWNVKIIDGRTSVDDRANYISLFQQSDRLNCLICHPRAAGHGLTLTAASYAIYYSLDFSWEAYQQSRDRIRRTGQTEKTTYIHLVAKGTVDEKILWALRHKRNAHDLIMEALRGSGRGTKKTGAAA